MAPTTQDSPVSPESSGGGSGKLGVILGASIGGGIGGLLLLGGLAFFIVRRHRRNKASDLRAEDGLRVQYAASIPTVTLHTSIPKGEEAKASTPRSAMHRQRNAAPFSQ
jgi:hypothetical protein